MITQGFATQFVTYFDAKTSIDTAVASIDIPSIAVEASSDNVQSSVFLDAPIQGGITDGTVANIRIG